MSLKPSIASANRNNALAKRKKLLYSLAASALVFLIALGIFASNGWLSKAESYAESLPVETGAVTEPTANPSPTTVPVPTAVPSVVPTPAQTPGPRVLSLYENGGTVTVSGNDVVREAALTQARTFLLRKWRDRGRGRLILVPHERGLTPRPRSFYIEPNPSGVWRITLEMAGEDPAEFYFVEEIGVDANGQPILTPRPGGPQAVTRALHLKQQANVKHGVVF